MMTLPLKWERGRWIVVGSEVYVKVEKADAPAALRGHGGA